MASEDDVGLTEGVEVRETDAGRFQVTARTAGGTFLVDEPVAAGGLGSGPTPYDLLSAALGACTLMTIKLYAERKAWPLRSARVRVLHRRDALEAQDRFAREIVLEGELNPEQRRRLLEIAERCPVHQTLARGSKIGTVLSELPLEGHLDPEPTDHASHMVEACEQQDAA
jgi:putative redox protein